MVADLWGKYVELVGQVTNEETGETMSDGYATPTEPPDRAFARSNGARTTATKS